MDNTSTSLPAPNNKASSPNITYISNSNWNSTYNKQNDFTNLFRFTAPSNMSIDTTEVFVQSGNGGRIKMAVYADQGGLPGSLLATSGEVASAVTGWNAASLSTSLSLTSGTAYWLAFNTNSSTLRFAYRPETGTTRWQVRSFGSAWPASLSSTDGPVAENWAIRAYAAP